MESYDIIVIGGGHAGCEAAVICEKLGMKVLLVTISMDRLAWMSCNPAIGGLAKGHLVKELGVLGGIMPKVIDATGIQSRKLNSKKGKAVQSTRVQADRAIYSMEMKRELEKFNNIHFLQAEVSKLLVENNTAVGVDTCEGLKIYAKAVIFCAGTFLRGRLHFGDATVRGGRSGEKSSEELSDFLNNETRHRVYRFKTGTPARLDSRTIDFNILEEQPHDPGVRGFSLLHRDNDLAKRSCYLTRTNSSTHKIISDNIHLAPLYSGKINSKGPRYCPSLEDKVMRFPDRTSHQVFLEPEGVDNIEFYANGISTGLPINVQNRFYKTVEGLKNVRIIRPAYAVEYDCIDSQELKLSLESRYINNLFFAGQINGTSGYEEAAAQGFVAGVNAVRKSQGGAEVVFSRKLSYIGVLIDDIVTKGVDEPYRMFTSRSENRLFLREDNADYRLYRFARENGFIDDNLYSSIDKKWLKINEGIKELEGYAFKPTEYLNNKLTRLGSPPIKKVLSAKELLRRPEIYFNDILNLSGSDECIASFKDYSLEIEIEVKYEGYIKMAKQREKGFEDLEAIELSPNTDYGKFDSLSIEVREKLNKIKPRTIAQAFRIPGVTAAAVDVLLIYKKRGVV